MTHTDLKPCPFCGSKAVQTSIGEHWVCCSICGAYGPLAFDRPHGATLWNARARTPDAAPRKPFCETCGKDVAEVLCPTCAKWWADNPPPAAPLEVTMKLHKTQGEWRRKLTSTRKYGPTHTDFIRTLEDLATLFAELDSLRAQLAETEAERDRQYEENVSQIMRYAALETQLVAREGIAREIAKFARHSGLCGIAFGHGFCTCGLKAVLARFHAAEGEG